MPGGAKISPIEKHAEKGVLAIAGVLLIGFAVHYLASSPRSVDQIASKQSRGSDGFWRLRRESLPPQDVDEALAEAGRAVQENAEKARMPKASPPEYLKTWEDVRDHPYQPDDLLIGFAGLSMPPKPTIAIGPTTGPPITKIPLADLQHVLDAITPEAPQVVINRELTRRPGPDNQDRPVTKTVAHVWGAFPFQTLTDQWQERMTKAASTTGVVVAGVELQRRRRGADGTWHEQTVTSVGPQQHQTPPEVPAYDLEDDNSAEVLAVIAKLAKEFQTIICRPSYWSAYVAESKRWVTWRDAFASVAPGVREGDVIWAHDENVSGGQAYAYRYRLQLVNPLLASPLDVAKESVTEATIPLLVSPWSPWSEPVAVPTATEFYVASVSGRRGVRVLIYTEAMGEQVESGFLVRNGEPIGDVRELNLANPISGQQEMIDVDFNTGAVAVAQGSQKGLLIRGAFVKRAEQVIYLDAQGELRSRLDSVDAERRKVRQP